MEIVLLWLDDLDDLLFAVALAWERVRRLVLQVGLGAALALVAVDVLAVGARFAPACAYLAASSVAAWLLGAVFRTYYYRASRTAPSPA